MQAQRIKNIRSLGVRPTLDLEVDHEDHNFYADGIVVSNSHSVSYGTVAAQTVYLKNKYPQQFFLACLKIASTRSDFTEQFQEIQRELPYYGVELLPPDLTKSDIGFKQEGSNIRFGLGEIKGISEKSLSKLKDFIGAEKTSDFDIFKAAKEAKLSIGILSALIQSGALGHSVYERSRKVLHAQIWNVLTPREQLYCLKNQARYKGDLIAMLKDYLNWVNDEGVKFTKESRLETIRKASKGYFQIYNLNHANELLTAYFYEKTLLGFSYSTTLKMIFGNEREEIRSITEIINNVKPKSKFELMAIVKEKISGISKQGNRYLKLILVDEAGSTPAMLVGEKLEKFLQKKAEPNEEEIVYITGQKGEDILWINELEVQNHKVYTKLSELNYE